MDGLDVVIEVLQAARVIGEAAARVYLEVHHTHPAVFEGNVTRLTSRRTMVVALLCMFRVCAVKTKQLLMASRSWIGVRKHW